MANYVKLPEGTCILQGSCAQIKKHKKHFMQHQGDSL